MVNAAKSFAHFVIQDAMNEYGKSIYSACGYLDDRMVTDLTFTTGTCCCFMGDLDLDLDEDVIKIFLIAALAMGVFMGVICTVRSLFLFGVYEIKKQIAAYRSTRTIGADHIEIYQNAQIVLIELRNRRLGKAFSEGILTIGTGVLCVALIIAYVIEPQVYMVGIGAIGGILICGGGVFYAFQSSRSPSDRFKMALSELIFRDKIKIS
ncbi:MAG: hypothetical protein KDK55_03005 [Chlamydiia bacterium]|nr:hypothetical protein [Chlamydiia bacterium]